MASESGFSNQKKLGISQFKTIHNVGSDKYGQSVASKALYEKTAEGVIVATDVVGKSGQIEFVNIEYASHNALVNDVFRMTAGGLLNFEFDVISIVDADNFLVLPLLSADAISGDSGIIMSWVTNKANSDGSQIVTLAPVPLQFVKDSSVVNVNEDTVTPANNEPLPVKLLNSDLDSTKDSVTIGDENGYKAATVLSSFSSTRSLAVFDDDANNVLNQINFKTMENGFLDYDNAWSTPLLANATFTGTAFNVTNYAAINVCVISDVASATDGLRVEFSIDGSSWDHFHATTYSGGTGVGYIFNAEFKFARVVYINGASNQTSFKIITIFKVQAVKPSLYTIDQAVNGNMFAQLNKSTIIGKTTGGGGGFVDVKVNPSGALTVEASVTGSVSVSNFPVTQPVSGSVSVSNFPATQAVTGTFWQATQPVSGSVSVSNFPATQPVSGSVSVSNFPATQAVTGTFWQTTQPVSGSVSVSNFPATQNTLSQTDTGSITSIQKAVGLTAVRATVSGSTPSSVRKRLLIKPSKNNTGAIYLGSSSVTTSSGLEIIGPDRLEFLLDAADYFLISDTAGQVVEIIEVI